MGKPETITIDDVKYVRADSVMVEPTTGREVVVCGNGWIFHGEVAKDQPEKGLRLINASNVRSWQKVGFGGMLNQKEGHSTVLDYCGTVTLMAVRSRHPVSW